jgi:hypothetical protein
LQDWSGLERLSSSPALLSLAAHGRVGKLNVKALGSITMLDLP